MKAKLEKLEKDELKVSITVDKKSWSQKQDMAIKQLSKKLAIKGFRPGHVPSNLARKYLDKSNIWQKALSLFGRELENFAEKNVSDDYTIIGDPEPKLSKITDEELIVDFIYPLYPKVQLPKYKGIEIDYSEVKATDKDIDLEINNLANRLSVVVDRKDAAKKGDDVVIDFKGFKDGKPFEGGESKNYNLKLGSGSFIPGFEEKIIGHKPKDKFKFDITFPKSYSAKDLAGKKTTFEVTLKSIKEKRVPKLDDNLAKEANIKGVSTMKELRAHYKGLVEQARNQEARNQFKVEFLKQLVPNTKVEINAKVLKSEVARQKQEFDNALKQQGMTVDQYLKLGGMSQKKLDESIEQAARTRLTEGVIFTEISIRENIDISEKDYDKEYEKLAKMYGMDASAIKNVVSQDQMQIPMINDRVLDFLIKHKKTPVKKAAPKKPAAKKAPAKKAPAKKPATKKATTKK